MKTWKKSAFLRKIFFKTYCANKWIIIVIHVTKQLIIGGKVNIFIVIHIQNLLKVYV